VDIAKQKHFARAIDDCGRNLVNRLVFENTLLGFKELLTWD
jgi:transposase